MRVDAGRSMWCALLASAMLVMVVGCKERNTASTSAAADGGEAVAGTVGQTPAAPSTTETGTAPTPASPDASSASEKAIAKAAEAGRYAFVLFHRSGESSGNTLQASFDQAKVDLASKAEFLTVDVSKGTDTQLIDKYGIDRAPTPVILALAPNGAVTKAFTESADVAAFRRAFVSQTMARMLRTLQDGKLVALCVQGEKTQHNDESMAAAQAFVADESLRGQAEVIRLDPADPDEAPLLHECSLSPALKEASIVLLVPPNSLIATVPGATTKAKLLSALQAGLSACGSGCGPGGCG